MKTRLSLILVGLIAAATASPSYAGCAASCPAGACRYESAGNYFYCTAVRGKAPGTVVNPRAVNGSAAPAATATAKLAPTNGPKQKPSTAIKSPRDAASGQATGRRQHKP